MLPIFYFALHPRARLVDAVQRSQTHLERQSHFGFSELGHRTLPHPLHENSASACNLRGPAPRGEPGAQRLLALRLRSVV